MLGEEKGLEATDELSFELRTSNSRAHISAFKLKVKLEKALTVDFTTSMNTFF